MRLMQISLLCLLVPCFALSCVTTQTPSAKIEASAPAPLLNSERIKQKFGSYGVRVLESKIPDLRVSNLFSVHDGKEICRTFAVTRFESKLDPALNEGHRRIVALNQSIGATFKELGFTLTKENLYLGSFEPKTACIFKLMGNTKAQPLAVYIYKLSLSKGDLKNLPYATIAEIQHPDYLSLDDLRSIYKDAIAPTDLDNTWAYIYAALGNLSC